MHKGNLMISMDPKRFGPHPSVTGSSIPNISPEQQEALNTVAELAAETELQLNLQTGEMLFVNNWAILHRRDGYSDDDKPSRHLVRLWLRNSELGWSVPSQMLTPWLTAFESKDNCPPRIYSIYPTIKYSVPKYSAGSAAFLVDDSDESDG